MHTCRNGLIDLLTVFLEAVPCLRVGLVLQMYMMKTRSDRLSCVRVSRACRCGLWWRCDPAGVSPVLAQGDLPGCLCM